MTDAEVICAFMEPKPKCSADPGTITESGWWWHGGRGWGPSELTLDELWKIQERLTDEQWKAYELYLGSGAIPEGWSEGRSLVHASAGQKVKALAAVLRPLVQGGVK